MTRRPRDEGGQVGGIEALAFGVLIFVIGGLGLANAWAVVDAKLAASSAAREAARAFVESPTADAAHAAAVASGRDAMAGHGRSPEALGLDVRGAFARCARITVEASYPVPLVALPLIGRDRSLVTVRSRHSEVVDPYRSGPEGSADCAAG